MSHTHNYNKNKNKKLIIFLSTLTSLLCSNIIYALPEDREKPVHITADSSIFDYKTGTNTYEGNVKVDQGSTHLTADRVVTKTNSHHKMQEAVAYGLKQLADYSTLPKPGDALFHAKARVIKFLPIDSTVILETDVTVTQGENSFQGPMIIYNMKNQTVSAPASESGRATIVIEPNKLKA